MKKDKHPLEKDKHPLEKEFVEYQSYCGDDQYGRPIYVKRKMNINPMVCYEQEIIEWEKRNLLKK